MRPKITESILNKMPIAISYWDRDLINRYSNQNYCRFQGKSLKQIVDKCALEVMGEGYFTLVYPHFETALNGVETTAERKIFFIGKKNRVIQEVYIPFYLRSEVVGVWVVGTDVTRIKRFEALQKLVKKHLSQVEKMKILGEIATEIAHEVNNPLTIFFGGLSILRKRIVEATTADTRKVLFESLSILEDSAKRISKVTNGLLDFSRDGENDPYVCVSFQSLIKESLFLIEQKLKKHRIQFVIEPFQDFYFKCRPSQISQVLVNLIKNSIDAIIEKEEKWIRVGARKTNNGIEVTITDSGFGVSPEYVKKLMRPFFSTKGPGKGTGLGLSISKKILRHHESELFLNSESRNTQFVIRIPDAKIRAFLIDNSNLMSTDKNFFNNDS